HLAHQPLHALAIDATPLAIEHRHHPPRAQERPGCEQLVDPPHQLNVVVIGRPRRPIYARSRNAQQLALPADRSTLMIALHPSSPIRRAHLPALLAKKSRSTVNCPILAWSFSTSSS